MPKMPKWMANASEKYFSGSYHPIIITKIDSITPNLKKIRFEGDLSNLKKEFRTGNIIEFRVSDEEYRHYTPSLFNVSEGVCEVFFYLNNIGIGSKWISELKENDSLKLIGPGGKIKYREDAKVHFVFGDETSIGLFEIFNNEAIKNNQKCFFLAELQELHRNWGDLLDLNLTYTNKNDVNQQLSLLSDFIANNNIEDMFFYLTGNGKSIQSIIKILKEKGIPKNKISSEPYWVEGKQGL